MKSSWIDTNKEQHCQIKNVV